MGVWFLGSSSLAVIATCVIVCVGSEFLCDTAANLKEAEAGETYEFKSMYPDMITEAKAEGEKAAERYFIFANKAEECHANLYAKAARMMGDLPEVTYHVCGVCGHIHEGEPSEKCPICGSAPKVYYAVA